MILHGKDDVGIQKSGFLWKQTKNGFKSWKQYYFVLTRLCLICYHRGSNGIQGKNPKLKIDLSDVVRVDVLRSPSSGAARKKRTPKYVGRQFSVWYGKKSVLVVRCDEEEETQEWVAALQDLNRLCSNRKKVHQELRRASFKLHVEQNIRSKVISLRSGHGDRDLPKVTYLNRTPWDERNRSVSIDSKLNNFPHSTFPPFNVAVSPANHHKRCYTYNENIVLSTPDIPLAQISQESHRFTAVHALPDPSLSTTHNSFHLDLSKSFSSDDMRMVGNSSKVYWSSGRAGWRNYRERHRERDDTDSGQGSEDSNVFSEGNGHDGNLLNITGNTSESGHQDQDSFSLSTAVVRPGKIQWIKDRDIPKDTREPEIVFNPSGLTPARKSTDKITSKGQTASSSQSKLQQGKWSSDLDLVPEGKEVSMFRAREHGEFNQRKSERKDHSGCFKDSNSYKDYDSFKNHNGVKDSTGSTNSGLNGGSYYTAQQSLLNRTSNMRHTKPHGLRRYDLQHDGSYSVSSKPLPSRAPNGWTQSQEFDTVKRTTIMAEPSFERQNKLYKSLDSAMPKHKLPQGSSTSSIRVEDDNYNESSLHSIKQIYSSQHGVDSHPPTYQNYRAPNPTTEGLNQFNHHTDTFPNRPPEHHRKSEYRTKHSHTHHGYHRYKYHDYEEAETDFSGPDDGETETVSKKTAVSRMEGTERQQYYSGGFVQEAQLLNDRYARDSVRSIHGKQPTSNSRLTRSKEVLNRNSRENGRAHVGYSASGNNREGDGTVYYV